jgi:hypothetical protein
MASIPNRLRERLAAGQLAIGMGLRQARTGGVYDPPLMERYIRLGARLVLAGSDLSFLMAGAQARAELLRGIAL